MLTISSITGPLDINDLRVALMHEHVLAGFPGWQADTLSVSHTHREMMAVAVDRIQQMQDRDICTMVDPCPNDLARDVVFSAELGAKTAFNIVCAAGLYEEELGGAPHWRLKANFGDMTEQMAELCIHELTIGIGDTDFSAGVTKLGTGTGQITDYERAVIQAAAAASKETGAPITTHTDGGELGDEQQRLLVGAGLAPHKIIIGHSCTSADHTYHKQILDAGSYMGFDRIGINF